MDSQQVVQVALAACLEKPYLATARSLEEALRNSGAARQVFGRINQKASLEANSESDRGIAERLANAFDASLTSARLAVGISKSRRDLTPRKAAQRFFSQAIDKCEWKPAEKRILCEAPLIEFWLEPTESRVRFKRFHTAEGLCTVLVHDSGTGIARDEMPSTILDLNSSSKLTTFEAIGQFGHGGSSSLAFCESALVISQPRAIDDDGEFYWTLIVPERTQGDSKQELVRHWFSDDKRLPFSARVADFTPIRELLPGTTIWHFGYSRGGWIKAIAGPEQTNPWGRLGRLFFSYPLPFMVRGQLARTDVSSGKRQLKGSFFRLVESEGVEFSSGERSESLILNRTPFGEFHVFFFVLKDGSKIRDYVDPSHPVIATLNGQNHGEMTKTVISKAGLPELSTSMIIELRLDGLDAEAQSNVINNSREAFKRTEFTRELESRLIAMLEEDDSLRALELARQEAKAREASADMSKKLSAFLSAILSDAKGRAGMAGGDEGPGKPPKPPKPPKPLPEIPAADPPTFAEFLYSSPVVVPEGTTRIVKFKSDARPPKYSLYGDNPRIFVELRETGALHHRVGITGKADLSPKGYGSVSISCQEDEKHPIKEITAAGELHLTLQSASGRTIHASVAVQLAPKPQQLGKRRDPNVEVELRFVTSNDKDVEDLKNVFAEENVAGFGADLTKSTETLGIPLDAAAYFGDKTTRSGVAVLRVEVNAGNKQLRGLLVSCRSSEERAAAKQRYCEDIVLDCYQHAFNLETIPEEVTLAVSTHSEEEVRAAEIYLNHDKAVRFAATERDRDRKSYA